MTDTPTLVLATRNTDKVVEIREILRGLDVRLVSLDAYAEVPEVEETGETLEANAILKAREVARATGASALADDTGLEVAALDGAPGVYSARYAGPDATYADNCAALLRALAGVPEPRRACFRTVVALATPGGDAETVEGVCAGVIASVPRGSLGFGYDPLFVPEGSSRTFAEMTLEEKNTLSHRGRAFRAARALVERHLRA